MRGVINTRAIAQCRKLSGFLSEFILPQTLHAPITSHPHQLRVFTAYLRVGGSRFGFVTFLLSSPVQPRRFCIQQNSLPKQQGFAPQQVHFSFASFLPLCSQCFITIQSKMLLHHASGCPGVMPGTRPHPYFWSSGLEGTGGGTVFQLERGCKYQVYRVKWRWVVSIAFQHHTEVFCSTSVGYSELKSYSSSRMRKRKSSQCQSR